MTNYDATNKNISRRVTKTYRDVDLNFGRNTVTNDVNTLTDADAVKKAVINLIQTNHYERPFQSYIGSALGDLLFELNTPLTRRMIEKTIRECIENFEPRCKLVNITVDDQGDRNEYRVRIYFYVVNHNQQEVLETFLERIR